MLKEMKKDSNKDLKWETMFKKYKVELLLETMEEIPLET